jgi:hypothetical protein
MAAGAASGRPHRRLGQVGRGEGGRQRMAQPGPGGGQLRQPVQRRFGPVGAQLGQAQRPGSEAGRQRERPLGRLRERGVSVGAALLLAALGGRDPGQDAVVERGAPPIKPTVLLRDGGSPRNSLSPAARTSSPCSADVVVVSPWSRTLGARGVSSSERCMARWDFSA